MRTLLFCCLLMLTTEAQTTTPAPTPTNNLPCLETTPACIEKLTALVIAKSAEIRVLDEAIKLQRKKMFTNYIGADSFNPLSMALKLARNIAGGGDVAAARLSISMLELRRYELSKQAAKDVRDNLTAYELAEHRRAEFETALQAHRALVAVMEVGYRSGDGTTETMLPVWEKLDFLKTEMNRANDEKETALRNLTALIYPPAFQTPKK